MLNKLKLLALYVAFYARKPFKRPSAPRPSSTVLLVRDGAAGLEVFMVVRHRQIEFASGALVFPGGKVDEQDREPALRPFCDGVDGVDDMALGLQIGAIRELFEESGILLARPFGSDALVDGERLGELEQYREMLHKAEISMAEFVTRENLRLACDQLHHYAHWVTPEMLPKRYDTHFYVVEAPPDQIGVHDGVESVDSVWIRPETALREAREGKRVVVFPTRLNLEKLSGFNTTGEAIAFLSDFSAYRVLPRLTRKGIHVYLSVPEAAGYGAINEPLENFM